MIVLAPCLPIEKHNSSGRKCFPHSASILYPKWKQDFMNNLLHIPNSKQRYQLGAPCFVTVESHTWIRKTNLWFSWFFTSCHSHGRCGESFAPSFQRNTALSYSIPSFYTNSSSLAAVKFCWAVWLFMRMTASRATYPNVQVEWQAQTACVQIKALHADMQTCELTRWAQSGIAFILHTVGSRLSGTLHSHLRSISDDSVLTVPVALTFLMPNGLYGRIFFCSEYCPVQWEVNHVKENWCHFITMYQEWLIGFMMLVLYSHNSYTM